MRHLEGFALGWVVGLIEGEGTLQADPPAVTVRMTDEDVIRRLLTETGIGRIGGPYQPSVGQRKQQWLWRTCKTTDVLWLLRETAPYFGERRQRRAFEILDRWSERTLMLPGLEMV